MVWEHRSLFTTEKTNNSGMDAKELRDKLKSCYVTPAGQVSWQEHYVRSEENEAFKVCKIFSTHLLEVLSFVDISCRYFCPLYNIMSTSFVVPKAPNTEK